MLSWLAGTEGGDQAMEAWDVAQGHKTQAGGGRRSTRLRPERIARAKFAYTTRRVDRERILRLLPPGSAPTPRHSDLVLAQVRQLGQHKRIELPDGRKAMLFEGDEIVLCFGNRYAPDQFEAVVPDDLKPCHMVAGGGVAARALSHHSRMHAATAIVPLGLLADEDGRPLNLADFALPSLPPRPAASRPLTIAVVGTSMNSGKTTTVACLVRGLTELGLRVAAAKVTGTGSGGDHWEMVDAGATPVLDFVDTGVASTYRLPLDQVQTLATSLLSHLADTGPDVIVFEIADGLLEPETAGLLLASAFQPLVDGLVFAAGDSMGACAGAAWLRERGLPVVGVSGVLTSSPLAVREAVAHVGLPVYPTLDLRRPEVAAALRQSVEVRRTEGVCWVPPPTGGTAAGER